MRLRLRWTTSLRAQAAKRYAAQATPEGRPEMGEQLRITAGLALALFAGLAGPEGAAPTGGLNALSQFIETSVPEAERSRIAEVMLRILNGALFGSEPARRGNKPA
jgi:cytochrome c biogenesis protein